MKTTDLADVPSVQTVPEPCKSDSRSTEQQIEEHCKDLERCMKLKAIAETSYLPISIQIIRQLQGCQTTSPAEIVEPGAS